MNYKRSEMLYDDGIYYKWHAIENGDNPYYRNGSDHSLLNRSEGYEVLYFINHLTNLHWKTVNLATYQRIERIIRYHVPGNIRSHAKVGQWIIENWHNVI